MADEAPTTETHETADTRPPELRTRDRAFCCVVLVLFATAIAMVTFVLVLSN
jgi:hypothetical protein